MSESHPVILSQVIRFLEQWAPPGSAQSYDNVGLQVGDPGRVVHRVLVALDLIPAVLQEAERQGANLIITHHPLLFRALKRVTPESWTGGLALRLAEKGIALYSIHTNLDAVRGGVSFALAQQLNLKDVRILSPVTEAVYKLATFVPMSHLDPVRKALANAGAGQIGDYVACAFTTAGTGYFQPGETSNPFIGSSGGPLESVQEVKLEVEIDRWNTPRILKALKEAHPYEEVAYDLYPVDQKSTRTGLGAIGQLEKAVTLSDLLEIVSRRLGARGIRFTGDPDAPVRKVAVCGGAGSDLTGQALASGADAYITADVTYHKFFDVLDAEGKPRMALIDAGHYETEFVTEQLLIDRLKGAFPAIEWIRTGVRTSPVSSYMSTSQ